MADDLFFRSCSPSSAWWDAAQDRPSSQLFTPTPKDEGMLSVASSGQTTPEVFYKEFTEVLKLESRGIWAVSKDELSPVENVKDGDGNQIYISAIADPGEDKPTGHYLLDLTAYNGKKLKKIAQSLRNKAHNRKCVYPVPSTISPQLSASS